MIRLFLSCIARFVPVALSFPGSQLPTLNTRFKGGGPRHPVNSNVTVTKTRSQFKSVRRAGNHVVTRSRLCICHAWHALSKFTALVHPRGAFVLATRLPARCFLPRRHGSFGKEDKTTHRKRPAESCLGQRYVCLTPDISAQWLIQPVLPSGSRCKQVWRSIPH